MTAYIKKSLPTVRRGFTLIELLIVIAILGVLAVVVLVAINPVQQLARTRDAGRISSVTQLGHAVEAYYTSHNGVYPPATGANSWVTAPPNQVLILSGEIKQVPSAIAYNVAGKTPCTTNRINNTWCYATGGSSFVVFARLEASTNETSGGTCNGTNPAYALYSSTSGRGCVYCAGAQPGAGTSCPSFG